MDNRVQYVGIYIPPYGIKRYTYYVFKIENEKAYVINDFNETLEYSDNELKELFTLEVGTWEEILKPQTKDNKK